MLHPLAERRTLVDTFFDALMINGAKTITDLSNNKLATYRSIMEQNLTVLKEALR